MKFLLPLFICAPICHADLVITEVMARSGYDGNVAPALDGDWWELTNTGALAVDLSGYQWDDEPTPLTPSISTFPAGISIGAGETIIILQEDVASIPAWKSAWGLGAGVQVLSRELFTVGESFSSFSANGDEVNLYEPGGDLIASVEFGPTVTGRTKVFLRDGSPIYGLNSISGEHGAANSGSGSGPDVGSPGDARLHFSTAPAIYGSGSYTYDVAVAAPSGTPVLVASSLPSFLSFTTTGTGTGTLASNRPLTLADAGNYLVQINASSGASATIQKFLITVLNPSPTVILNEYNAVSSSNYLNGGTLLTDQDGGDASSDGTFGRVLGNGGDWVEWVVVGEGTAGLVDLSGWRIEIGKNEGVGFTAKNTIVFSNHADWKTVPTGTILTFTEKSSAQGGRDSQFAIRDHRSSTGDTWSNVWIGDPTYLVYTSVGFNGYTVAAGSVTGIQIDNDGTQFRIKNSAGQIVYGPVGEGVAPIKGTSSEEVFELENHPSPAISPTGQRNGSVLGYDDGASESTFGLPNNWVLDLETVGQDFSAFAASGFLLWTEAEGLSGADAITTADPDLDGRDNLTEYAFGGDPELSDASYSAGSFQVGASATWSLVRRANDPDLVFTYEESETLDGWDPISPSSSNSLPFSGDADFETLTLSFDLPVPTPSNWFLRARAE